MNNNDSSMQKRMIIALVISMLMIIVYQYFFMPDPQKQPAQQPKQAEKKVTNQKETNDTTNNQPEKEVLSKKDFAKKENYKNKIKKYLAKQPDKTAGIKTYETKHFLIKVDLLGGRIKKWIAKKHDISILNDNNFALYYKDMSDKNLVYNLKTKPNGFELIHKSKDYEIKKIFSFNKENDYLINLNLESNIPFEKIQLSKKTMSKGMQKRYDSFFYYDSEDEYEDEKVDVDKTKTLNSHRYIGFDSKYMLAAFLAGEKRLSAEIKQTKDEELVLLFKIDRSEFKLLYGPKKLDLLSSIDPTLEKTIHLRGFLSPISKILLQILDFIQCIIKNWGLAIIILTILIKLVLYPLTHKSFTSMAKMKKIQPEMQKIRKQHKDDPQKMNKKMMELYSEHGVNPAGGCLPLLLQFPILIALFSVFNNAIELKGQPFILWINDLSNPDALLNLPFEIPLLGSSLNLLPILMVVAMVYQQNMSTGGGGAAGGSQKFMKLFMPIFMFAIFYNFPAGLVLYFLTNTAITLLQQKYIYKHLNNDK